LFPDHQYQYRAVTTPCRLHFTGWRLFETKRIDSLSRKKGRWLNNKTQWIQRSTLSNIDCSRSGSLPPYLHRSPYSLLSPSSTYVQALFYIFVTGPRGRISPKAYIQRCHKRWVHEGANAVVFFSVLFPSQLIFSPLSSSTVPCPIATYTI
jgi:hypothetical protein